MAFPEIMKCPLGNEIILTRGGWKHIVGEHAEVSYHRGRVRPTIENPLYVWESAEKDTYRFYKDYPHIVIRGKRYRNRFFCVIVNTQLWEVKTALLPKRMSEKGEMIWHRLYGKL